MSLDAMKQALEALEAGDWYIGQLELLVYTADDTDTHRDRAKVRAAITALRAAVEHAERPQTHSEECWRWHHQCAVAKIERGMK